MSACCGSVRSVAPARDPLDLVGLRPLMELTAGSAQVVVGIIDGPVLFSHKHLAAGNMRVIGKAAATGCTTASSAACLHGTFVAGILAARRGAPAPAICPECTFIVRPVFAEANGKR